jgi:hypothetical protein
VEKVIDADCFKINYRFTEVEANHDLPGYSNLYSSAYKALVCFSISTYRHQSVKINSQGGT